MIDLKNRLEFERPTKRQRAVKWCRNYWASIALAAVVLVELISAGVVARWAYQLGYESGQRNPQGITISIPSVDYESTLNKAREKLRNAESTGTAKPD